MSLIRKIGMISCDAKRTPTTRAILTLRGAAGRRDEGFLRKLENSPQERGILGWGTRPPRRVPFSSFVVPLAGGVGDSRESSKTSPEAIEESPQETSIDRLRRGESGSHEQGHSRPIIWRSVIVWHPSPNLGSPAEKREFARTVTIPRYGF